MLRGRGPRTLTLALAFGIGACIADPAGPSSDQIMKLTISTTDGLLADGESFTTVTVEFLGDEFAPSNPSVSLTTSSGELQSGAGKGTTITTKAAGGVATAELRSGRTPSLVVVRASSGDIGVSDTVSFKRAAPETVVLTTAGTSAAADGNAAIQLTAELRREVGDPSVGQTVTFRAFVEDAGIRTEVSELRATALSGDDNKATASMRSNTVREALLVTAEVTDPDGAVISSEAVEVRFVDESSEVGEGG